MSHIFAAVHWVPNDDLVVEAMFPEVLVVTAESLHDANEAIREYIRENDLGWETYNLEWHLRDTGSVVQLGLDPEFDPEFAEAADDDVK